MFVLLPTASLVAHELEIAGKIYHHFGFVVDVTVRTKNGDITLSSESLVQVSAGAQLLIATEGYTIEGDIIVDDQDTDLSSGYSFAYLHAPAQPQQSREDQP